MFCWDFDNAFEYSDWKKSLNDNRFSTGYIHTKLYLRATCNPEKFVKNKDMAIVPFSKWNIWINK